MNLQQRLSFWMLSFCTSSGSLSVILWWKVGDRFSTISDAPMCRFQFQYSCLQSKMTLVTMHPILISCAQWLLGWSVIIRVCSSLIKQRVKISFVIFCKLCGVVKFYVSSSTQVYIILVYLVLVFDWKAVYILSSALARLCFCIIFVLCSNWPVVLWHISWWKCFRYLCYNYKVFHLGQLHSTEVNK